MVRIDCTAEAQRAQRTTTEKTLEKILSAFPLRSLRLCGETDAQTVVEWALIYAGVLMPLTFAIIFTSELLWMWHSVVEFTRDGARYAATHCWQASGENVLNYMHTHVPRMIDMDQFQNGQAEVAVQYYSRDPGSGTLAEFSCDGGECSAACIPDLVTVRVSNYTFRRFFTFMGLPGIPLPDFHATVAMESAGCDPEQATCSP